MDFKKYGPFFEVYKLQVTVSACDVPVINLCPKTVTPLLLLGTERDLHMEPSVDKL